MVNLKIKTFFSLLRTSFSVVYDRIIERPLLLKNINAYHFKLPPQSTKLIKNFPCFMPFCMFLMIKTK